MFAQNARRHLSRVRTNVRFARAKPQRRHQPGRCCASGALPNPKPDEPEPNKDYDRRLREDVGIDHGYGGIDRAICGESARRAVVL